MPVVSPGHICRACRTASAAAALILTVLAVLVASPVDAQRPTFGLAKPHPYGRQTDAGY